MTFSSDPWPRLPAILIPDERRAHEVSPVTTLRIGQPHVTMGRPWTHSHRDYLVALARSPSASGLRGGVAVTWVDLLEGVLSDGYTALAPGHSDVVADLRYTLGTSGLTPLWGVRFKPDDPVAAIVWVHLGGPRSETLVGLWRQIVDRPYDLDRPAVFVRPGAW